MAHRYLGPKLVTFADATVDHILVPRSTSNTQSILAHAAGEAWLFSLADFHIISFESAFGRMGAMLASNWESIVQLDNRFSSARHVNLTYTDRPANTSEARTDNATLQATQGVDCKERSQPQGPAFCWPGDDVDKAVDVFSGKSLKETCETPHALSRVATTWVGVRRN
jgi:hypothetical protein